MTKKKGKAKRRIKDWSQRFDAGIERDTSSRKQKVTDAAVKLPAWRAAEQQNLDELPRIEGMVMVLFPGGAVVRHNRRKLLCGIAGTFRAPEGSSALAVGDIVTVANTHPVNQADVSGNSADKDRADGMIMSRQTRLTALSRPQPTSGKHRDRYEDSFEKVIVANMDVLLIVASTCEPAMRHGLIERFLIIAERGDLAPVLVINKTDLAPANPQIIADLQGANLAIIMCSAKSGEGIDRLRSELAGRSSVLAGASGVGKSTLINALIPQAQARTATVRAKDLRGRHTTAAATIYDLPNGGIIVDTPGIRELALPLKVGELPWYFTEFQPFINHCRFNDCTHTHEPDCAVIHAVQQEKIPLRRYESYLKLLESI